MWWIGLATAAPYSLLAPAGVLPWESTEMGAGASYVSPTSAFDAGLVSLHGWARYGLADRVEVAGGASVPVNPVDLVIYGGVRGQLLGPLDDAPGPRLSVGAFAASQVNTFRYPSVAVPLSVGARIGDVDLFVTPTGQVQASIGGAVGIGWLEAGVTLRPGGFPVTLAATVGSFSGLGTVAGMNVGAGYDLAM